MNYKHEIRATLKNGDVIGYNFNFDNSDFEHIVFALASEEAKNITSYFIKWDENIFSIKDDFFMVLEDKTEMFNCLTFFLDCIHRQLKGVNKIISSQSGMFNSFIETWTIRKENLELMEECIFSEYCEYSH